MEFSLGTDEKEWKIVVERIVGRRTNDAEVRKWSKMREMACA